MDQVLLDSFQENLALIHPDGKISATNLAWKKFALENGADPSYSDIDRNYIELLSAVQTKEIVPYFQPEIDTVINKVVSMEMLSRWNHPVLGFISPQEFIPIAEESGQLQSLTEALLERAIHDLHYWQRHLGYKGMLSINVTSQLISEDSFCDFLIELKREAQIEDNILELELTENMQLF